MIATGAEFRVQEGISMASLSQYLGKDIRIVVRDRILISISGAGACAMPEDELAVPLPDSPQPAKASGSPDARPPAKRKGPSEDKDDAEEDSPVVQPSSKRRKCNK